VTRLFTEMSPSYDIVNLVSSFGFSGFWRAQCVGNLDLRPGNIVADLMSGSGECGSYLRRRISPDGKIVSVDICPAMCKRQQRRLDQHPATPIEIRRENALSTGLPENSVDHVVSACGLKTFDASMWPDIWAKQDFA
jgi:demethylmenaquinone methyltransferase/2-methoxy-6-polyprenyl-1,4-benzoquinol methylase